MSNNLTIITGSRAGNQATGSWGRIYALTNSDLYVSGGIGEARFTLEAGDEFSSLGYGGQDVVNNINLIKVWGQGVVMGVTLEAADTGSFVYVTSTASFFSQIAVGDTPTPQEEGVWRLENGTGRNSLVVQYYNTSSLAWTTAAEFTKDKTIDNVTNSETASYVSPLTQSAFLKGDLYVDGTISASILNVEYITSSVSTITGSTKFGDELIDVHEFTGSVDITGSLSVNGVDVIAQPTLQDVTSVGNKTTSSIMLGAAANTASNSSFAQGNTTTATGQYSHAEGQLTVASGDYSHAEGRLATATGNYAHAEGTQTIASAVGSHAEGRFSIATGTYSHAEGIQTTASGVGVHTEGALTTAQGDSSHAEGYETLASGNWSHVEGRGTIAYGIGSHAEGYETIADANYSHAEGRGTLTSASYQSVVGRFNQPVQNANSLFIIGDGADTNTRKNLVEAYVGKLAVTGALEISGALSATGQLNATASQAITASFLNGVVASASYAITASNAEYINVTGSGIAINWSGSQLQLTASAGDSFPYTGSAIITGSLEVIGDQTITNVSASNESTASFFAGEINLLAKDTTGTQAALLINPTQQGKIQIATVEGTSSYYAQTTDSTVTIGYSDLTTLDNWLIGVDKNKIYAKAPKIELTGSVSITGSLEATASNAVTASYVNITGSGVIVNYNGDQIQLTGSAFDNITSQIYVGQGPLSSSGDWKITTSQSFLSFEYWDPIAGEWVVDTQLDGTPSSGSANVVSASFALTASYLSGSIESASYAFTASYLEPTATASYALTASYVVNSISSSYASTASYYGGTVTTASYAETASYVVNSFTASYLNGTASWAVNSLTASYVVNSHTASYLNGTASWASNALTASQAATASYLNATASWASNALTASYVENAVTASYLSGSIVNYPDPYTSTVPVTNIVTLTVAEYIALVTKDPNTIYVAI